MSTPEVVKKLSPYWLRIGLSMALFALVVLGKTTLAQTLDRIEKLEAQVAAQVAIIQQVAEANRRLDRLEDVQKEFQQDQKDAWKDQLQFQRDMYQSIGEYNKAKAAGAKASEIK